MKPLRKLVLAAFAFAIEAGLALAAPAQSASPAAPAPGVSAHEIVVATISDLSGPIALLGVPVRDGMLMRFASRWRMPATTRSARCSPRAS
jgi:hypothetical protein